MRKACINCARKHLANAEILLDEAAMGYPSFFWLAIGHMDQASSELIKQYPEVANNIRDRRVKMIENHHERLTQPKLIIFDPDIMELIDLLSNLEEQELTLKEGT